MADCLEYRRIYKRQPLPGWSAGAISESRLSGDGYFGFRASTAAVGIVVGLNDNQQGNGYQEIDFGLWFERGQFFVVENGQRLTNGQSFDEGDWFYIVRARGGVYYTRKPAGQSGPFTTPLRPAYEFPGQVEYASDRTSSSQVFLDTSFYAVGDKLLEATFSDSLASEDLGGDGAFRITGEAGSNTPYAFGSFAVEGQAADDQVGAIATGAFNIDGRIEQPEGGDGRFRVGGGAGEGAGTVARFEIRGSARMSAYTEVAGGFAIDGLIATDDKSFAYGGLRLEGAGEGDTVAPEYSYALGAFVAGGSVRMSLRQPRGGRGRFGLAGVALDSADYSFADSGFRLRGFGVTSLDPENYLRVQLGKLRQPNTLVAEQPASTLEATGEVERYGATLTQPASIVEGRGAWHQVTLDQLASEMTIEGTNPPFGAIGAVQPRSTLEASGTTGAVGGVEIIQPRSTMEASDGWKILLDQSRGLIDAGGLTGTSTCPDQVLAQPDSEVKGDGRTLNSGSITIDQPSSYLVQNTYLVLDQPEALLTGAAVSDAVDTTDRTYVINYDNGGVTTYDWTGMREIVEFNGTYYGVGDDGVYRLDSGQGDDGSPIRSEVRFAGQELSTTNLSRATYLYFLLDSKEPFTALLNPEENKERQYRVQGRLTNGAHTRKVQAAKGISSRVWQAGLIHEGTDFFRIYDVEIVGERLKRKI